jgi:farnesol dehydrogenase
MILITGGSGYLGQAVARRLVRAGHPIRLLVRRDLHVGEAPAGADIRQASLEDAAGVARALEGCTHVVHMAAVVRRWTADPHEFERINVRGLAGLIEAARRARVERFIYTSSFLALGPTDGTVHGEDAPRLPLPAGNPYAESKRRADELARQAAASGVPLITLYPGVLYGPGPDTDGNLIGRAMIDHLRGGLPGLVGGGRGLWSLAYIEDVANGHLAALERAQPGERFILGGENVSLRGIFERLGRLAAAPPPLRDIPFWAARLVGTAQVWRARLTGRMPDITPDEVEIYRHDWAYSSEQAQRRLGYTITPLDRGLADTLEWARARIRDMERGR